jgi:isopentenyl-diphosphate Delta-isomerase
MGKIKINIMMNKKIIECVDILDKNGNQNGEIKPKSEVHEKGLWHKTVHIWFINSKNEVLLQRRSKNKENSPDMWDVSVGGHVSSGEDLISAAIREVKEEVGIKITPKNLEFIGTVKQEFILNQGTYIDNEFLSIYIIKIDIDNINQLSLQKEEVQILRWIPIKEFKQWADQRKPDLVIHDNEYKLLFEKLYELLK